MSDQIPKDHVPLLWPDGRVRLATTKALNKRPEFYKQNGCVKYDGPWPPPMNEPVDTAAEPKIIVPSYLESEARRVAADLTEEEVELDDEGGSPADQEPEDARTESEEGWD